MGRLGWSYLTHINKGIRGRANHSLHCMQSLCIVFYLSTLISLLLLSFLNNMRGARPHGAPTNNLRPLNLYYNQANTSHTLHPLAACRRPTDTCLFRIGLWFKNMRDMGDKFLQMTQDCLIPWMLGSCRVPLSLMLTDLHLSRQHMRKENLSGLHMLMSFLMSCEMWRK